MNPQAGLQRLGEVDGGTAGDRGQEWVTQQCHSGHAAGPGSACWVDAQLEVPSPTAFLLLEFHSLAQGAAMAGQVSLPGQDPLHFLLTTE